MNEARGGYGGLQGPFLSSASVVNRGLLKKLQVWVCNREAPSSRKDPET